MESILISIKKLLGITKEDDHFDADLIMHINSVFMILNQLGVGPSEGYAITGEYETWEDYVSNPRLQNLVKSYIHYKVKLLFDPPASSVIMECMNQAIREFEWRLNIEAETNTNGEEENQNGELY